MNVEVPAKTEAAQILDGIARIEARQQATVEALNKLGANVQWIINGVSPIMEMMGNPQMMSMLPGLMGGAMGAMTPGKETT
jgi:hypothetical protein